MKEDIEKFKEKNGNIKTTETELIWYIAAKVDNINDKIGAGEGKIAENRTEIRGLKGRLDRANTMAIWILGLIITLFSTIFTLILKKYGVF